MSELTQTNRRSGVGRALQWLALLLTLALLGFVTAVAVRNNPIYSDREANGISKYRFIEQCKEAAADAETLTVNASGQAVPLKTLVTQSRPLATGERIGSALEAPAAAVVAGTQSVDGGGWTLAGVPVTISIVGKKTSTLGQLPLQCSYDKKAGKTTAQLQLPGQGQGQ
ncbi:hypothetical protein E7T09_12220 [Deinococcus sp. KSM4-11]|uniref:hypothetical protein n=1 Tax=Deinococcus sp. KSM4-11 TaxID=2568654 RepID=UPI0010A3F481|nr:hypothetical protein [Deinococcus sp. KSM4-11]THF86838.1 hypothetical protein E7T09_12220 [Deinococcus sp. KSM4-11]